MGRTERKSNNLDNKFLKVESLRQNEPKNQYGAADLNAALNIALQKFRALLGSTQEYVKDIFQAGDVSNIIMIVFISSPAIIRLIWKNF